MRTELMGESVERGKIEGGQETWPPLPLVEEGVSVPLEAWRVDLGYTQRAWEDVSSRYGMHATLSWGLPWAGDGRAAPLDQRAPGGRLLWFLDNRQLIVQAPATLRFDMEAILARHPRWGQVTLHREIDPALVLRDKAGAVIRLRAQLSAQERPGKRTRELARERGEVAVERGLLPQDMPQWLARQGERGGFELLELLGAQFHVHRDTRAGKPLCLPVQDIDAVIRVTDARAFEEVMRSGLGRARSFGCGLVRISPL